MNAPSLFEQAGEVAPSPRRGVSTCAMAWCHCGWFMAFTHSLYGRKQAEGLAAESVERHRCKVDLSKVGCTGYVAAEDRL